MAVLQVHNTLSHLMDKEILKGPDHTLLPMVFKMLIIIQVLYNIDAQNCMTGQYKVDGHCCYPCDSGYRIYGSCSVMNGTRCLPCKPGTYTEHPSALKECLPCKVCDLESGFMTRWECTSTSNTVCTCSPGYFCTLMKGDDCEMCEALCSPGQYVKSQGTDKNNAICEKCQTGTFSTNGTLDHCLPWTKCVLIFLPSCTAQGLVEVKPGTVTADTVCSSDSGSQTVAIILISVLLLSFGAALFFQRNNQARESRGGEGPPAGLEPGERAPRRPAARTTRGRGERQDREGGAAEAERSGAAAARGPSGPPGGDESAGGCQPWTPGRSPASPKAPPGESTGRAAALVASPADHTPPPMDSGREFKEVRGWRRPLGPSSLPLNPGQLAWPIRSAIHAVFS
ncbi:uncharacterized protein LOC141510256 [Macrotis lagotis]|uniref:uncharacterized protein LOC141510256 n=1 Tax=Macrotis lagotis TaxID=92651 RepID=UPI003D690B8C